MRPQFKAFRLIKIEAAGPEENTVSGDQKVNLHTKVELALLEPNGPNKDTLPLMVLVKIHMDSEIVRNDNNLRFASVAASYEGAFEFDGGLDKKLINDVFSNEDYQRELVSQVYPLAIAHLGSQLAAMGFAVKDLPFGLPI